MKETVGRSVGMLSNLIRRHFSTFSFHGTLSGAQGKTLHFILARSMDTDVFQKDVEEEYSLRPPTATKTNRCTLWSLWRMTGRRLQFLF